ncbi:MAG: RidA family protein [Acidimicrobiia bacterium]
MPREVVNVEDVARLPAWSHAVITGPWIHVSGTCGAADDSFDLVPGGTGEQTTQTLRNIERILQACGASLDDVVHLDIYLLEMDDFHEFNTAYTAVFGEENPPTRTTVSSPKLGPRGARVEINCVAYRGEGR